MARPKREMEDEREVTLSYKDYSGLLNFLAVTLQANRDMAMKQMHGASSILQASETILKQVQNYARSTFDKNGIEESSISKDEFGALRALLSTNPSENKEDLSGGLMNFSFPLGLGDAKPKKKRKQRKPKDPNAPKRPVTAFFLFLQENKENVKNEMPPNTRPGEIQKQATVYWNELSAAGQEKYKETYRKNFEKYKKQLEEYKKSGGHVDDAELEPDNADAALNDNSESVESSSGDEQDEFEDAADIKMAPPSPAQPVKASRGGKKRGHEMTIPDVGESMPFSANLFDEANYPSVNQAPAEPEKKKKKKGKSKQTADY